MKKLWVGLTVLLSVASSTLQPLKAQDLAATVVLANEAEEVGNFVEAERHWMRVLFFAEKATRFDAAYGLGRAFHGQERFSEAARQFDFAADIAPGDSMRAVCILEECKSLMMVQDYEMMLNRLAYLGKQELPELEKRRQFYFGNAFFGKDDMINAEFHFVQCSDLAFTKARIHDLFDVEQDLNRKSPGLASVFSLVVPGSGQLYAGKPGKALNAVVLVGGLALCTVYGVGSVGLVPAVIIFGPTFMRYYLGSSKRAAQLVRQQRHSERQWILEEIYKALERDLI